MSKARGDQKPNIVWLCTDQQRFDTIACLGNPHIRTPAVDGLVKGGVAFTKHYVQSPICTPSRASFMTGRYPRNHGVLSNGIEAWPASETMVTKLLADHGYLCGLIGKLHLTGAQGGAENRGDDGYGVFLWSNMPRPEDGTSFNNAYHHWLRAKGHDPFELFQDVDALIGPGVAKELHQTTWLAESACDFIRANPERPWMLSLNPFAPHHPFDPPQEYLDRYDAEALPDPLFEESDLARQEEFAGIQHQTYFPVDPRKHHPRGADEARFPDGKFANHKGVPREYYGKAFKASYYAMIEHLDDAVAMIYAELEATGQLENTIFIFTSDHGEMLGDHGLLLKGARFFDGAVRVPMVVHWPAAIQSGLISNALTEAVDIAPTLLDAAGIEVPWYMQGKSLMPILTGESDPHLHKEMVLCEFIDAMGKVYTEDRTRATMTFDGRHKLVSYHGHDLFELFDLEEDPGEYWNRWDDPDYSELRWKLYARQNDLLASQVMFSGQRTMLF